MPCAYPESCTHHGLLVATIWFQTTCCCGVHISLGVWPVGEVAPAACALATPGDSEATIERATVRSATARALEPRGPRGILHMGILRIDATGRSEGSIHAADGPAVRPIGEGTGTRAGRRQCHTREQPLRLVRTRNCSRTGPERR